MSVSSPDLSHAVLSALVDLGTELQAEEIDLRRVLELATENAARLLETESAWLSLFNEQTGRMRVAVSYGVRDPGFPDMEVTLDEGLGGEALRRRGPLVVADYASWARPGPVRDTMLGEGIASVVCAPMLRGDAIVGVLYAANHKRTAFTATDASIVATLAAQASVAISNGRLYRTLLDKTSTLEATFDIHRALGEAAVTNIGIDRVVNALSELMGRRLLLEQRVLPPFELLGEPSGELREDPAVIAVIPVRRSQTDVGRITVYGSQPLSELEQNALSHGATVLALELMKHEAAHEVEWSLRGELLDQLLEAGDDQPDALVARARRFGLDLGDPCTIVVVEARSLEPAALSALVRRVLTSREARINRRAALSGQRGNRSIVALIGDGHVVEGFASKLADEAAASSTVLWIGTSSGRQSVAESFREAAACAQLARQASADASRVVHGSALGPLRFMLDIHDLANARAFVHDVLGAVAAHEEAGGAQLLTTLRAFIEEDGRHQRIASRCHVHVSTVKYRLTRISELVGRPLSSWETRFEIALAFRLADLLQSLPEPPAGALRSG